MSILGGRKRQDDNDDVKQYQDAMKRLGEQFDASQKELAQAKARVTEADARIKQLENDLATLKRNDLSDDQKAEERVKQAQQAAQQAQTQLAQAQAQAQQFQAQLTAARRDDEQAKTQIQSLQNQVQELQAQLAQAQAQPRQGGSGGGGQGDRTYTVQPGDSLRAIAQRFYGNEMEYMRIFHANRDQLNDPDLIHPGQVLHVPHA